MRLPDGGEEPAFFREEPQWGVSRDPPPPQPRSPMRFLIWVMLTILIILSLVLPYILPYFYPRRIPVRDGLQASQRYSESAILANSPIR
jgi:hypothetical protein